MGYATLKIMIKYNRKPANELKAYCDVYLKSGKINAAQYDELVAMIASVEE